MIRIDIATAGDTEDFLASAIALVATDAGRFDAEATDVGWADRSGAAYAAGARSAPPSPRMRPTRRRFVSTSGTASPSVLSSRTAR